MWRLLCVTMVKLAAGPVLPESNQHNSCEWDTHNMAPTTETRIWGFCVVLCLCGLLGTSYSQDDEHCAREGFTATCPRDQVIIMTNATYGRMRLGRCIRDEYQLGCSADALPIMHTMCSGHIKCTIPTVVSAFIDLQPCGEMLGYLEAAYRCETVVGAVVSDCEPGMTTSVPLPSGTLANVITGNSGCGNSDHPWVIEAASTQKITLALTNLTPLNTKTARGPRCEVYATVKEGTTGKESNICANDTQQKYVYTSEGNKVQLILRSPAETGDQFFLIHYNVTGCPEPSVPQDMWVRRSFDHVTVGCYTSRLSWRLECHDNTWQGEVGNCTELTKSAGGHYIPEIASPAPATDEREPPEGVISSEVGLLLAVAGGVFLSVLLLAVGLLFDKSRETSQGKQKPVPYATTTNTRPVYGTNTSLRKPAHNTTTANGHSTVPRRNPHPGNLPNGNSANHTIAASHVRDSMADRSSIATGYYDVPHYYELDPDYEDGGHNAFVSNGEKNVLIDLQ